jgi:hypothetical protein
VKRLLPAALWFFVSAWWFLADAWLAQALGAWRIDLTVALCVFATFTARAATLPWLVLCAGLARALTLGGAACAHILLLGIPVAVLFPLRGLPLPPSLLRSVVAGVVALVLVLLPRALPDSSGAAAAAAVPGVLPLLWTMATAPCAAAVLGRLPPLWFFRERRK